MIVTITIFIKILGYKCIDELCSCSVLLFTFIYHRCCCVHTFYLTLGFHNIGKKHTLRYCYLYSFNISKHRGCFIIWHVRLVKHTLRHLADIGESLGTFLLVAPGVAAWVFIFQSRSGSGWYRPYNVHSTVHAPKAREVLGFTVAWSLLAATGSSRIWSWLPVGPASWCWPIRPFQGFTKVLVLVLVCLALDQTGPPPCRGSSPRNFWGQPPLP